MLGHTGTLTGCVCVCVTRARRRASLRLLCSPCSSTQPNALNLVLHTSCKNTLWESWLPVLLQIPSLVGTGSLTTRFLHGPPPSLLAKVGTVRSSKRCHEGIYPAQQGVCVLGARKKGALNSSVCGEWPLSPFNFQDECGTFFFPREGESTCMCACEQGVGCGGEGQGERISSRLLAQRRA